MPDRFCHNCERRLADHEPDICWDCQRIEKYEPMEEE